MNTPQPCAEEDDHANHTAGIEEIMYRLYVLENIRHGQEDAAQGKTTPAKRVLRDVQRC